MADSETLVVVLPKGATTNTTVEAAHDAAIELGQWYWVKAKKGGKREWLGCVNHIGSNYVEMEGVTESDERVHIDDFHERCRLETNASQVIDQNVQKQKKEVQRLMAEVVALTARLDVGQTAGALGAGGGTEGQALARLDPNQDVAKYKSDLVRAKDKELPELFKSIEKANEGLATWLKAETFPMKAQLGQLEGVVKRIDDRIFNVELYAGLTETIEQITEGEPAAMLEKVRLMQRRCYMDEECLAHYEVGGMEFKNLREFDAWLAKPVNRDRILPFPRCIVAFKVRREAKHREVHSFVGFFEAIEKMRADELTFLYIRNGDLLYRMNTKLKFDEQLFPDVDHDKLVNGTKLWAHMFGSRVDHLITDAQFQGLRDEYKAKKAQRKIEEAEHPAKAKAWKERKRLAKEADERFTESEPHLWSFYDRDPREEHEPFEPNNIYYDDMQKKIAAEIRQTNRIAIIIQGLLDRSIVLHPHPPWKIWSEGGADQALELVYDTSRALVGGERPDFEAYRQRLNASIKAGSITVGQRTAWKIQDGDERKKSHYRDPGPDVLAKVLTYQRGKGRCSYAWHREGESRETFDKKIRVLFSCDVTHVLNVDAYTPGDFKQFFSDPRTRADYLQWAPLLLEAEEYHAGNRKGKVEEPPPPNVQHPSWERQRAYRRRKDRERLMGKKVRLADDVSTTSGTRYKKGTLWLVTGNHGGGLDIHQLNETTGERMPGCRVSKMQANDLVLAE